MSFDRRLCGVSQGLRHAQTEQCRDRSDGTGLASDPVYESRLPGESSMRMTLPAHSGRDATTTRPLVSRESQSGPPPSADGEPGTGSARMPGTTAADGGEDANGRASRAVREPRTTSTGGDQDAAFRRAERAEKRRAAARRGAPLGKNTNNSSRALGRVDAKAAARKTDAKQRRYGVLNTLWGDSMTLERVRKCRRVSVAPGGQVGLRADQGAAGFSGLAKCGSVWSCPVCAAKIARERADELRKVLDWAVRRGHTVAMVTANLRHHKGHRLEDSWNAASGAWSDLTSGTPWAGENDRNYQSKVDKWAAKGSHGPRPKRNVGWKGRTGLLGWVRAVEVTHGENGWHPHIHTVMIFEGEHSKTEIEEAIEDLWPRWKKGLEKRGFSALKQYDKDGHGALDVRVSTEEIAHELSEYFTKFVSLEVTNAVNKTGKKQGGRTPFQLAHDAYQEGDADALDAWYEWMETSEGRQQLTWSKDLRQLAGLAEKERSNEEIAEENLGTSDLVSLPAETWRYVRDVQVDLLIATETDGLAGAIAWLDARNLAYELPIRAPDQTETGREATSSA